MAGRRMDAAFDPDVRAEAIEHNKTNTRMFSFAEPEGSCGP